MADLTPRQREVLENMNSVEYGGEGLGISQEYPVEKYGTWAHATERANWQELNDAGFDRPGEGPIINGEKPLFFVLRNIDGDIVASWDEGRWWTPRESEAFLATMMSPAVKMLAETTHAIETKNREQRRRRRK